MGECVWTDQWGLYEGRWQGLLAPSAMQHPAKFSPGLATWIIRHGLEQGYWKKGDLLGDPFAGVACGGIVAAYASLRWLGVELEPRFILLARESFALNAGAWAGGGLPHPVIVQGDSRRFASLVGEAMAGCVTSPPYVSGGHHSDQTGAWGGFAGERQRHTKEVAGYGQAEGQIGQLPEEALGESLTPTYWSEVAKIYQQVWLALKPQGVLALVCKDYIRAGKRVPLCDQTATLLERVGFRVFERTRCHLGRVTEEPSLFGGALRTEKRRVSFFRRLHEKRRPDLRIDFEQVMWCRRAEKGEG